MDLLGPGNCLLVRTGVDYSYGPFYFDSPSQFSGLTFSRIFSISFLKHATINRTGITIPERAFCSVRRPHGLSPW